MTTQSEEFMATVEPRRPALELLHGGGDTSVEGLLEEQIRQLQTALLTARTIGRAQGIEMAHHRLTADEAFLKLVHLSQACNVKLSRIAQGVVDDHEHLVARGVGALRV